MSDQKIITTVEDLDALAEELSRETRICFDVETISFDDALPAFNPWKGCRIGGLAVCLADGRQRYVSVRHRDPEEPVVSVEAFQRFLQKVFCKEDPGDLEVFGHNVKFDMKFLAADNCVPTCRVADTMVLARHVDNTLQRLSLDALGAKYGIGTKTKSDVDAFVKSFRWTDESGVERRGTKDFGRVPLRIMAPYSMRDCVLTYSLRRILEGMLAECSRDIWQIEKTFTKVLAEVEREGVRVDMSRLKTEWIEAIHRMIEIHEEVKAIAGWEVDLNSEKDKTELLVNQMGVVPTAFTGTGKAQWTKAVFNNLNIPEGADPRAKEVGKLLQSWSYLGHFTATYLEGWFKRADDHGYLHPDLKQAGTTTGRLSASDPNTQNIPVEAERYIIPPDGHVIISFDFSQIEYRVFAHYTDDPTITDAYKSNPDADFHQFLADMLGVPRQFAKTMNFAFLYGMGKKKLLLAMTAMMQVARVKGDTKMEEKLRNLVCVSGIEAAERAKIYADAAKRRTDAASQLSEEQIAAMTHMVQNAGVGGLIEKGQQYLEKMKKEQGLTDEQAAAAHDMIHAGGNAMVERAAQYLKTDDGMAKLAEKIFEDYHARFPSIKQFSGKVNEVATVRKWVRNIYGRRYDFDMSKYSTEGQKRAFGPHRAVNYLIQGSCADMLRKKIIAVRDATKASMGSRLFMTVHDSVYYYVPREHAAKFYVTCRDILEDCPEIKVPIRVEGKVCTKNVAADVGIKEGHGVERGVHRKDDGVLSYETGGERTTEADIEIALSVAPEAAEHSYSAAHVSRGYRVGRHGV